MPRPGRRQVWFRYGSGEASLRPASWLARPGNQITGTESTLTPRLNSLTVKNLRSIGENSVHITFPQTGPLVLIGENNAGKSNIMRALDILFGETWPGSRRPEEHDFHDGDSDGIEIVIRASVSGVYCSSCGGEVQGFRWAYDPQSSRGGNPLSYEYHCSACARTYPSNALRGTLIASVLDANRRLDYQLSYASKYTMLSKLMHKFHERLLSDPARKARLRTGFETLRHEFAGVPEFTEFTRLLEQSAWSFGQNLPYRLDIDFSAYDPSNFFRSLRVHPKLAGEVRNFDELGTGQSQILALAFAYAYALAYGQSEGTILVVDEPEANLHPLAQQWLARQLASLSSDGLQVVVTTHSPDFVDLLHPENIVLVSKTADGATRVVQRSPGDLRNQLVGRGAHPDRTKPDTLGPFYASAATGETLAAFFARSCVLVEGRTEALALPALLKLVGFDVVREGVAVVPVEGIGNIAKWHRLYSAFGLRTYCVFDTDSDKTKLRDIRDLEAKRSDIMLALGRAKEEGRVQAQSDAALEVRFDYATMASNFETAARLLFDPQWTELVDQSVALVGESKPLQARWAAEHLTVTRFQPTTIDALEKLRTAIAGDADEAWQGYFAANPEPNSEQAAGDPESDRGADGEPEENDLLVDDYRPDEDCEPDYEDYEADRRRRFEKGWM